MSRERPILFSGPMVRAILEWRKTQTRRVVKPQPAGEWAAPGRSTCPFGVPGDRLWVREKHYIEPGTTAETWDRESDDEVMYAADGEIGWASEGGVCWRPSIHMPRWASRIALEVTGVRVERVQDIGKDGRKAEDVLAEGIAPASIEHLANFFHPDDCPALAFAELWDSINGKTNPWASNPWVWVVEFRRMP